MLSPFVRYTILRLLAFFACLLLLFAIPWMRENPLILLISAALLSAVLSLFFFRGPRDEMSGKLAERIEHRMEHKQAAHARRADGRVRDEDTEEAELAADQERYR
ncbi:MAG: DUF4229 domain-containing protein [Austwickia sp.]|jgi:hypothetical protein|nr:MAG: DUF4229 domain-containing protein [Austwickia sp.]